jgi:hypothetical protein
MYFPASLPKEVPPYLVRELQSISQAFETPRQLSAYDILNNSPEKPRDGQFYVADGTNWDPGYGPGPYLYFNGSFVPMFGRDSAVLETAIIACSDETKAITTGAAKVTFRMPWAATLVAVKAGLTTAPTGSTFIADINKNGTTVLSTKLSVDVSEKTSYTAASAAVISVSAFAIDDEVTIDFDQVGSTVAGTGVKITLFFTRAAQ